MPNGRIREPENQANGGQAQAMVVAPAPLDKPPLPVLPDPDAEWLLTEEGFGLAQEHEIESRFAVSNGYLGSRAAMPEGEALSSPATFVAGVFERLIGSFPELMAAPDWISLAASVDGQRLAAHPGGILEHRRMLDLRHGLLWRELRYRDPDGRITRVIGYRLASLANRHLLVQSVAFLPENHSGRLRLESRVALPGPPHNPPQSFASGNSGSDAPGPVILPVRAAGSGVTVAFAGETAMGPGSFVDGARVVAAENGQVTERIESRAEIGMWRRADRIVSVYTSREAERPAEAASAGLHRAVSQGVESIVDAHVKSWESRWQAADIEIEGDPAAQRTVRFACYHLIGAANPEDERASIGARALTGTAYKGHVFWDTEIYMLPFYIFTHPPSARALLMYRYHTLPAAREKARAFGYRGAMYPWESADTGEEVTPTMVLSPSGEVIVIRNGEQEQHITADVPYGVWQYWRASGDNDFFLNAGAEIMLETARFWASRGHVEEDRLFHIRRVIGPDEYHENVDDNVYTNLMAQWSMERGAETAAALQELWPEKWLMLAERLALTAEEVGEWTRLARIVFTNFDPQSHLSDQFQGYFELEQINLADYEPRSVAMDLLLGHERIQRTNVVKQADTLMALYLLWDRFSAEAREANFRYYEPRTGHGSSLSPSIHALLAARLGDQRLAERYFRQAAEIDLANNMGNAAGGVHAAALGGLWQAVIFGFAGLEPGKDRLTIAPRLPARWQALRFPFEWRGRKLRICILRNPLRIDVEVVEGQGPVTVTAGGGPAVAIQPGCRHFSVRGGERWGAWEEVRT